jgi:tRNA(fMet)-specific endonuclease VapC
VSFLLDTNTCIFALRGSAEVIAKLKERDPGEISVSTITLAELWFGARKSRRQREMRAQQDAFLAPFEVLAFDAAAAEEYARIRAELERRGRPIGERDQMIAAIACANRRTLVSNNTRELARVPELSLADWLA